MGVGQIGRLCGTQVYFKVFDADTYSYSNLSFRYHNLTSDPFDHHTISTFLGERASMGIFARSRGARAGGNGCGRTYLATASAERVMMDFVVPALPVFCVKLMGEALVLG
jgi:hypothetical protein